SLKSATSLLPNQMDDETTGPFESIRGDLLSFAKNSIIAGGKRSWDVALFLPLSNHKERQTAASRDTKRRSKSGRFYGRWRTRRQGPAHGRKGRLTFLFPPLQKPSRTNEVKPRRVRQFAARAWPL